jgi:hypothetical protein
VTIFAQGLAEGNGSTRENEDDCMNYSYDDSSKLSGVFSIGAGSFFSLDTYATVFSKESVADTTTTTAGGTSAATSSPSNQQQLEEEAVVDEGHEIVKGSMAEREKKYAASR